MFGLKSQEPDNIILYHMKRHSLPNTSRYTRNLAWLCRWHVSARICIVRHRKATSVSFQSVART